jgi:hypothetical protein
MRATVKARVGHLEVLPSGLASEANDVHRARQERLSRRLGSRDPIEHFASTDFGGSSTDVTFIRNTAPAGFVLGSIKPTDATRSTGAGSVVSFDFLNPQSLPRDRTSLVLVIHTTATDFVLGTTSVIDGAVATVVTRSPKSGPEPATLTLFGGGLLGLAGLFGRRWLKQAPVVA